MKKIFLKLNSKKAFLIIALSLILTGALIGGIYGYYIHKNQEDGYVKASNFYFQSDHLTEQGKTYILNVNTKEITFKLQNFADELRTSENDISYIITSTGGTLSKTEGMLTKNEKNTDEITLSNLENGKTYTVTASANAGYTKTISATFTVRNVECGFYKNINKVEPYINLTIWTENIAGVVTIEFPSGVIPDNTCEGMENVKTIDGKFTIEIDSYSSYEFRFFKDINFDFSKEFIVTLEYSGTTVEAVAKEINK